MGTGTELEVRWRSLDRTRCWCYGSPAGALRYQPVQGEAPRAGGGAVELLETVLGRAAVRQRAPLPREDPHHQAPQRL